MLSGLSILVIIIFQTFTTVLDTLATVIFAINNWYALCTLPSYLILHADSLLADLRTDNTATCEKFSVFSRGTWGYVHNVRSRGFGCVYSRRTCPLKQTCVNINRTMTGVELVARARALVNKNKQGHAVLNTTVMTKQLLCQRKQAVLCYYETLL